MSKGQPTQAVEANDQAAATPERPASTAATTPPLRRAKRMGEALVEQGVLSQEQLESALEQQKITGLMLGEMLVEQGMISAGALVQTLARWLNIPGCQLRHGLIDPALMQLIDEEEARRLKVVPMFKVHDVLTVAMAEPQSLPTIDRLRQLTRCRIRPVFALELNIVEYLTKYAGGDVDVDAFLTSLTESDVQVVETDTTDDETATNLDKMVEGSPIINLVNVALLTAIRDGASDIHIEPQRTGTRIRYRIDGILRDLMKPPAGMHSAIVSRVKVIGKMDIAEKRLPQEGRVRIFAQNREIDLRISSLPTLLGEKLVVRVLDKSNLSVRMEELGFRIEALTTFRKILDRPHGLVLVTGPTGSGKTTTLYSALDLLRSPETNIVTVEDPVEYQLDLINQIQVESSIGLTFARALRSILRQDPDIIMIGEIRDNETASVAVQAALTGHLVLATLHTNDAPGAVARLLDMEIEPYLLSSALNGVIAQRLARTVCPSCTTKYYPEPDVLEQAGLDSTSQHPFKKGAGCTQCHNSGFQGRVGIYEVMELTSALRGLIHRGGATHQMRNLLRQNGNLSLHDEGILMALEGKSSLEEAMRVTQTDDVDALVDPGGEEAA